MKRLALARSISRMPLVVATTAFGLALNVNAGAAAHLCTVAQIDDFSTIYLTIDRTKETCRRFLVRVDEGSIDQASACRACAAAEEAEKRLSEWFAEGGECASDLHADEIKKTFERPLEILHERCGP